MININRKGIKFSVENCVAFLGIIIIFVGAFSYYNEVEKEDIKEKDITENKFYELDTDAISSIKFFDDSKSFQYNIVDDIVIEKMLDSFQLATYGIASHPTAVNSNDIYIELISNSSQRLYLLYCIIMKEGLDRNVVYYRIKDKPTYRYKSIELYNLLVELDLYDDIKREFVIKP